MKKIILFLVLSFNLFSFGTEPGDITYEPKVGVQVNFVIDNVHLFDLEAAKFITLDVFRRMTGRIDLGFGLQWNEVDTTKNGADGALMSRMPVYAITKLHMFQSFPVNPYIKLLGGYQIVLEDAETGMGNGSYLGAGIGLELGYFVVDYSYTVEKNEGTTEIRGAVGHALSLGYRF